MMQRAYGPNDLASLPANTAAANPVIPIRSKIGWVKHVNYSPYLFLLVDDTNQVRNVVAPWSVGATELLAEDADTDNLVLVPVVKASQNGATPQGVWWEFRKNRPVLTVDIEPNAPLATTTPQNENIAQLGGTVVAAISTGASGGYGGAQAFPVVGPVLLLRPDGSARDLLQEFSNATGDGFGVALASQPSSPPTSVNATNGNATITYAGVVGQKHRLTSLSYGFEAAPGAGVSLQVTDNVTVVKRLPAFAAGAIAVPLAAGGEVQAAVNTSLSISLGAGGAAVTGDVNAAKLTA